ncbi:hypothetical protein [Escherichia phage vB_EcoM_EP32a]|nr:hypothetical protein [Escherichia phage vB_EcoM_EP32a]
MVYVYAIVYRDMEGFTVPVPLDEHRPAVFFRKDVADKVFDTLKTQYKTDLKMGALRMVETPRKFWFNKLEMKHVKLDAETQRLYQRILDTGRIVSIPIAGTLR